MIIFTILMLHLWFMCIWHTCMCVYTSHILNNILIEMHIFWINFPVNVVDGETLTITKVSRLHMAAYLCVASNGVPPSISKRVLLRVQCKNLILLFMNIKIVFHCYLPLLFLFDLPSLPLAYISAHTKYITHTHTQPQFECVTAV